MNSILADAIDIPFVLGVGLAAMAPLLLFEVLVEALVLKKVWRMRFGELCGLTLAANFLSLLAGMPVKILNWWLYDSLLPQDLPGYFSWYPIAISIGTLIYFGVTLAVEGGYAFRWLRRRKSSLAGGQIWKGVILANLATYIVLAPLNYFYTRPSQQIREFTRNASWSSNPTVRVIFIDAATGHLKGARLDGSAAETIVPMPVMDYLVSPDLKMCLFRGTNGNLYFYRRDTGQSRLVWETKERFSMNQVAFSPSGECAAFVRQNELVEIVNLKTGKSENPPATSKVGLINDNLVWSTNDAIFYGQRNTPQELRAVSVRPDGWIESEKVMDTNKLSEFICYGRVTGANDGRWSGGNDWGPTYEEDSCGDFGVWSEPGLASGLGVFREGKTREPILRLSVNPGLLHIAEFNFGDVAFLPDCRECLFEANGYLYLLDYRERKVGTVAHGRDFILLTPRYQKRI